MRVRRATLPFLLAVLLWLSLATVLAVATRRIADWFVMTDELLYERLAIGINRLGTPFPHVHDAAVSNINQLYPLLLSFVFRHGLVPHGFHQAHVLNAFVMTSAAIPAYLLAQSVTGRRALSLVVAAATASVVWLTLASFLLTEVVAYPAFAWAVLAMHRCMSRPAIRTDILAVAAICVAVLARTQFYLLAAVLPTAILGRAAVEHRVTAALRAHRALIALYGLGAVAALVAVAAGHNLLGTYSSTTSGNPFPPEMLRAVPAHLAVVGLATGLLPVLLGGAWLVGNLRTSESDERFAFAWLGAVTVLALCIEVSSFDLRFGGGTIKDRYLFYIAPVLFVALAAALSANRPPRWSLAFPSPCSCSALGRAVAGLRQAERRHARVGREQLAARHDARAHRYPLVPHLDGDRARGAVRRGDGAAGTKPVVVTCSVLLVIALPAETAYGFKRLFAVNGTSGLPITLDQSGVFNWIDRAVGRDAETVMIPYPVVTGDYWANIGYWWDLEFWNRSVTREAWRPDEFSGTPPGSFPKLDLRFGSKTGRASVDLDAFVAQSLQDSRFHIAGRSRSAQRGVAVVEPARPWHADWVSTGLYADGWTRPGQTARIRVFALPGQSGSVSRGISFFMFAPDGAPPRLATFRSNRGVWKITVSQTTVQQDVSVCVPPHGYADLHLRVRGASPIPGDLRNIDVVDDPRQGGVLVRQIALGTRPTRAD